MDEHMTIEEQRTLRAAVGQTIEKAWGIGAGLTLATGLFAATNFLIIKGGSNVGSHLQLLHVYFPGYSVTFGGSVIGSIYAFVSGYLSGRTLALLYHRLATWIS